MRIETEGARDHLISRMQCMRDITSLLDLELDDLNAHRQGCCGSFSSSSGECVVSQFHFADSANPERDGTYAYVGITDFGKLYARTDGTLAINSGIVSGAGAFFYQAGSALGPYYWMAGFTTDWSMSPNEWIVQSTPDESRLDQPYPNVVSVLDYTENSGVAEQGTYTFTSILCE